MELAKIEEIARVAHEVNRVYCKAIGDSEMLSWAECPEWQRVSCIAGVQYHVTNPGRSPEESHKEWLAGKQREGWVYGPVKDAELKQHPCMVPYAELPSAQKVKDYLFVGVVEAMR